MALHHHDRHLVAHEHDLAAVDRERARRRWRRASGRAPAGTARPSSGGSGWRACGQAAGCFTASRIRLPSNQFVGSMSRSSVCTSRPNRSAHGFADSCARCSGLATRRVIGCPARLCRRDFGHPEAELAQVIPREPAVEDAVGVVHLGMTHEVDEVGGHDLDSTFLRRSAPASRPSTRAAAVCARTAESPSTEKLSRKRLPGSTSAFRARELAGVRRESRQSSSRSGRSLESKLQMRRRARAAVALPRAASSATGSDSPSPRSSSSPSA